MVSHGVPHQAPTPMWPMLSLSPCSENPQKSNFKIQNCQFFWGFNCSNGSGRVWHYPNQLRIVLWLSLWTRVFCKVMGEWSACPPLSRSLGAGGYSSCFPPHPPSSPHTSAHLRVHASCASSFSFALHILHNCTHKCCALETRFCLKTWSAEFTLSALSTSLALVFCNNPTNTKQFPSFKRWQIISRNSCRRWSFPPPPASPRWALLGVGHHWPAPACK